MIYGSHTHYRGEWFQLSLRRPILRGEITSQHVLHKYELLCQRRFPSGTSRKNKKFPNDAVLELRNGLDPNHRIKRQCQTKKKFAHFIRVSCHILPVPSYLQNCLATQIGGSGLRRAVETRCPLTTENLSTMAEATANSNTQANLVINCEKKRNLIIHLLQHQKQQQIRIHDQMPWWNHSALELDMAPAVEANCCPPRANNLQ